LSVPRGEVKDIKILLLLWLADRRLDTQQSESELNELTRLDSGMDGFILIWKFNAQTNISSLNTPSC
jgi:hypothetical protein